MMQRLTALVLLLVGLALSACSAPPESRVALSEPGETAYDERLVGVWHWTADTQSFYLHISPQDQTAYLDVVAFGAVYEGGDPVRWFRATGYASEIDGRTYYNVKRLAGAGFDFTAETESPGFIIMRADVTDEDALNLRFLGWTTNGNGDLERAIEEGRVNGREVEGGFDGYGVSYYVLALSRPELIALIREVTPEKLFWPAEDAPAERKILFRRLSPFPKKEKKIGPGSEG